MSCFIFNSLTFNDYDKVYNYMSQYGEGSCQHSFVSMYILHEKYGDMICEKDGFLYVLRSHLEDEEYRVYLAPMGDGNLKEAYQNILDDAHHYNKKAKFITLTEKHKCFVEDNFPEVFETYFDRDLSEYIFSTEKMMTYPGKDMKKRRLEANSFRRTYEGRIDIKVIEESDFADILEFQKIWMEQNIENHDEEDLKREFRSIKIQFDNYDKLHLSGIVLRIDGAVQGYEVGTILNDNYYDAIIEKGNKELRHIHKVLRQEYCIRCVNPSKYYNIEEDLGIEGLRLMKNIYHPEFLLDKYVVNER